MIAFWVEKRPREVSKSDGRLTYESQVAVSLFHLDYIAIFSRTPDEHIDHDRQVLILLRDAGWTLNLKNCEFFTNCIDFSYQVIFPGRLEVSTGTIEAICRLQRATAMAELRSFLGLCNVLHGFFPNLASISAPLNKKIRKCKLQTFDGSTDDEITALETLKERLVELPGLALSHLQDDYTVDTNACNKQIRCALL